MKNQNSPTPRLSKGPLYKSILISALLPCLGYSYNAQADQQILDDLIVDGSACIGQDCVNGESFGFDTIRLKENNLRIKFEDTSSSASFPSRDWQLTANDSSNGGQNKFSIDDVTGGKTPFTVEAGAPSHSLYVDDGGRLGLGTNSPVVDVHVKSGNTPTLRLEQDGTSGFTAQTWDVAGNEANFFIRDTTNGSALPFRIYPGAPSNALTIEGTTGDIGMGTTSPEGQLHIQSTDAAIMYIENASVAAQIRLQSDTTNRRILGMRSDDGTVKSQIVMADDEIQLLGALATDEFASFDANGMVLAGSTITVNGQNLNVPDYVFEKDHELMPLQDLRAYIDEYKHLPEVPSAAEIDANGFNMTEMQLNLLKKVEELTLYTLAQQDTIDMLNSKLTKLEN